MLWVFGCQACGILAPLQGTEATPCAERRSLNRWTAREVPPGHFRAVKTETHKGGVIWAKLPGARGIALSNIPQGSKIVTFQKRAGALITRETCYIHCEHKSQLFILGVKSRAKFSSQEGGKKKKERKPVRSLDGAWLRWLTLRLCLPGEGIQSPSKSLSSLYPDMLFMPPLGIQGSHLTNMGTEA